MIKTAISDLLGIEKPIIQGGMAWVSEAGLASAVSNAGGLGIIAAGAAPADYVINQVRMCRALTSKPFGVNVMLLSPYAAEVASAVADERVPVVTTGAGAPEAFMAAWLENGVKVVPVIPSVAIARKMEQLHATAVIAEGGESGGHIGELTTMALVPQVCDAVGIPVIAAGGIGDGRGFAASLMLGAQGVQMGTRFIVAKECQVHQTYKDKILKAGDLATIATGKRLGHPARSLKTPFSTAYAKKEYDSSIDDSELGLLGVGALRLAAVEGDPVKGCYMAGQIAGLVKKEQTAQEIVDEVLAQAEEILKASAMRFLR
jgi:enoyl-[acyl-carrier protein] reductase II